MRCGWDDAGYYVLFQSRRQRAELRRDEMALQLGPAGDSVRWRWIYGFGGAESLGGAAAGGVAGAAAGGAAGAAGAGGAAASGGFAAGAAAV